MIGKLKWLAWKAMPSSVKRLARAARWIVKFAKSIRHNRPPAGFVFNEPENSHAPTFQMFADPNGTFYPKEWKDFVPTSGRWKAHSLLNQSLKSSGLRSKIDTGEQEQLADLKKFAEEKDRLFVFVHGYNNDYDEALSAYEAIEDKINFRSGDGIVRLFWDGLTGANKIAQGRIWFFATGYSQMAGQRALRRILNQLTNKEIYFLSHSRGTSVILSALGNAVWDPTFLEATKGLANGWGIKGNDLMHPKARQTNGNLLHVLTLAPAVDRIDFGDAAEQPDTTGAWVCEKFRDLPGLESFRFTINPKDPVLTKMVGLQKYFNPTGLGCDDETFASIRNRYPQLKPYRMSMSKHDWMSYIRNAVFDEMLKDAGILRG